MKPPQPPSRNWTWLLGTLLVAATFLAYLPAWNGRPIWDDNAHITRPDLQSLHGLARIWIQPGATQQYYPLVHSFFWLEHRLWGNATLGYHLVNILFHALSAVLLLNILRRLEVPGAWLAAAIFALHPVEAESVAWISELKNTLSATLCFGSVLAYLEFDRGRRGKFYVLALGLFVLGLAAKSVIATLPAALLVVFWWKRGTLSWKRDALPLLPFFTAGIAAGIFTSWMERHFIGAQGSEYNFTLVERCLIAGRAIWFYLSKLFWPADLIFSYPRWNVSQAVWWQYLFPLAAGALLGTLWLLRRRGRGLLAAMLFFVGTLFPALGFFSVYPFRFSFVADHFQYLAGIGPMVLTAAGIHIAFKRFAGRRAIWQTGVCVVLLAALGVLTWRQCRMYSDVETLWQTTIARNPGSWMARNNLGYVFLATGRVDDAISQFNASLAIKPDYEMAHNNLASALLQKGQLDEAMAETLKALAIQPNYPEAHNNLGVAFFKKNRVDEAIGQYQTALSLRPNYTEVRDNLGVALLQKDEIDAAMAQFQQALALEPDNAEIHYNFGIALLKKGRVDDAVGQFQRALAIQPDYPEARYNLDFCLLQKGRTDEAIASFQKLLAAKPDDAGLRYNLGVALLKKGQVDEAISQFQKAVAIRPGYAEAQYNLGFALLQKGQMDGAIAQFQMALALQPNLVEARYNLGNALLQKGRTDEAIVQFNQALAIQPHQAEVHNNLGAALLQKGRVDEAIAHFRQAVVIQPDYAEAYNNLGLCIAQQGRASEAIVLLQKALALQPGSVQAQTGLAGVAWRMAASPDPSARNGAEALELARQLDQLAGGNNPTMAAVLAAAYAEMGRFPEAVAAAQRSLQLATAQNNAAMVATLRTQLKFYQSGSPFRDDNLTNNTPSVLNLP